MNCRVMIPDVVLFGFLFGRWLPWWNDAQKCERFIGQILELMLFPTGDIYNITGTNFLEAIT